MAKLFKNAVISSETVNLMKPNLTPEPQESLESSQTQINELQIEIMQKEFYQQGYLFGKTEGKALVEQEITLLKQQLEAALIAIPDAVAQNRLELNSEIAEIVLLITQQLFIEKEANPHALELQINQILTQLNNKQTIELCLHPLEIEILQKGLIKLETAHLNNLKIKADETLSLGGYVIKTNNGTFDARIEKQIDKLKEYLLEIRQRGHHATLD